MKHLTIAAIAAALSVSFEGAAPGQSESPIPDLVHASHATPETKAFFLSYFRAKTARDVDETMKVFAPDVVYIDATLGWPFYSHAKLKAAFDKYMPLWPDTAKSYPTRVLGNMSSAVIAFTDTPELFGGEIRIYAAVDFKDGKIIRQIDYWDGRNFGIELAATMRTSQEAFPKDFRDSEVAQRATSGMSALANKLHSALTNGDANAAAALFSYDAVMEDLTLHTQIVGSKSIAKYLDRSLAHTPAGVGSKIIRVLGSDKGGGFEWYASPPYRATVKRGITALAIDENGRISRMSLMWDSSLLEEADVRAMAVLSFQ